MLHRFNQAVGALFDLFFFPFREMNPWVGFTAATLLTAVLMLLAYRFASNQRGIHLTKDRISAYLLEVRLYRDDPLTVLRAQALLLAYNLRYLGHSLVPFLVLMVPLALVLVQMDLRFGRRALAPSETAIVKIRLEPDRKPTTLSVTLDSTPGLAVETPPLRIDTEAEINWRIRAIRIGSHTLWAGVGAEMGEIQVEVYRAGLSLLPATRVRTGVIDQLLNPGLPPLPVSSAIRRMEVDYPARSMPIFGLKLHWIIPFFLLTFLLGLSLKGLFRIEM